MVLNVVNGTGLELLQFDIDGVRAGQTCYPCVAGLTISADAKVIEFSSTSDPTFSLTGALSLGGAERYEGIVVTGQTGPDFLLVPNTTSDGGEIRYQVTHGAPDLGVVDVYLNSQPDVPSAGTPVATLVYGQSWSAQAPTTSLFVVIALQGSQDPIGEPASIAEGKTMILVGSPGFVYSLL